MLKHKQLLQGDPKLTKPLALSMFNTFYYLLFCVILGKCRIQVFLKVWPCWPQGPFETATIFSEYRGGPIFCSNVLAYFDRGSKASFYNILRPLENFRDHFGLSKHLKNTDRILGKCLFQSEARSHVEVNLLEVKYRSLTRLSKFLESLKGPSNTDRGSRSTPFRRDFDNDLEALRKWLMKPRVNFSEDELEDLECELQRLHQAALLVKASCVSENIGWGSQAFSANIVSAAALLLQ